MTYSSTTNADGSVTQSSYTVSLTATVDRDGNVDYQVTQKVTPTTETRGSDADGNPIIVTGSYKSNTYEGKLNYKSTTDKDSKSGVSSVAFIKKETGLSPLQGLANYQNEILGTPSKARAGFGFAGTISGFFTDIKGLKGGPVTAIAGAILYVLPKSNPENLSKTIKII